MKKLINTTFKEFYRINELVAHISPMRTHYQSSNPVEKIIWRKKLDCMSELLSSIDYQTVLDVGCGDGGLLETVNPTASYTGVDISPTQLKSFRKHLKQSPEIHSGQVKLLCHDATHLPFKTHSFDLILACDVLEHVLNPELLLKQIDRLVKPGGHVLIGIPNEPLWEVLRTVIGRWPPRSPDHIFYMEPADITNVSESLRILSKTHLPFTFFPLITLVFAQKDTSRKS